MFDEILNVSMSQYSLGNLNTNGHKYVKYLFRMACVISCKIIPINDAKTAKLQNNS